MSMLVQPLLHSSVPCFQSAYIHSLMIYCSSRTIYLSKEASTSTPVGLGREQERDAHLPEFIAVTSSKRYSELVRQVLGFHTTVHGI